MWVLKPQGLNFSVSKVQGEGAEICISLFAFHLPAGTQAEFFFFNLTSIVKIRSFRC